MFIIAPGVTKPGSTSNTPVSMMDIFPTLVDLIGEKIPAYCDGESLVAMLKGQKNDHKPVLSSYELKEEGGANSGDGHAIRTNRYRYIYYPFINFEELYDHDLDKNEWTNIAYKASSKSIIAEHRKYMQQQVPGLTWKEGGPKGYTVNADGSVKKNNYIKIQDLKETRWGI